MILTQSSQETEAAIKYFLAQALGSSILLLSSNTLFITTNITIIYQISLTILLIRLLIKLGIAPFHF